ncbi:MULTISPECIES: chromosome partitioning protein ParA [unclassified Vibrio]|uniref:Chromosome partitioning protein ParA n=1 Tax=Vibrio sp. HB236076 TaxID=3232307 RepID=A0AB39H8Y2_9VIBR|nr:chromosome partitioning protein ParA [Vibrio sp. HB161653]MDP5253872.1 chromosome partitioning protein ParA [Vibrio sp. HB161653]
MTSINGLPSSSIHGTQKSSQLRRKKKTTSSVSDVSSSAIVKKNAIDVKNMAKAEDSAQAIHYDLPEGRSRKALQEYMGVLHQAKREELAQMLGVDLYI